MVAGGGDRGRGDTTRQRASARLLVFSLVLAVGILLLLTPQRRRILLLRGRHSCDASIHYTPTAAMRLRGVNYISPVNCKQQGPRSSRESSFLGSDQKCISSRTKVASSSSSLSPSSPLSLPSLKDDIKGMSRSEMEHWFEHLDDIRGELNPKNTTSTKRAWQLWGFLHGEGRFIRTWEEASKERHPNGFSPRFISSMINDEVQLNGGLSLNQISECADGTRKYIFSPDKEKTDVGNVEAVAIPMERTLYSGTRKRLTICVSSQVGCAMGCEFCFTGLMGLRRNLTTAQIVEQVLSVRRDLPISEGYPQATNIVFMGMGEPFDNMDSVVKAINILTTPGPNTRHFSPDRITVSTVGLVPQIKRFRNITRARLAISLHATTDEVRSRIMPVNRRYNLSVLVKTLEELYPASGSELVLIEYLLLAGVNDDAADAQRLLELTKNIKCMINLIEYNSWDKDRASFQRASRETTRAFEPASSNPTAPIMITHDVTPSKSAGHRETQPRGRRCWVSFTYKHSMAACGQLGNPEESRIRKKTRNNSPTTEGATPGHH
eukprot:jgi/Bigna1/86540/estExt_fgenesh1_pg.C_110155